MEFREHMPLAPLTTLQVGGRARYFAEATTEVDAVAALMFARERRLPVFILGGGSNLLVSDAGFAGLVLKISTRGIDQTINGDIVTFSVAAGEDWDAFVAHAVAEDNAGIECLSGIPGTVGATPVQNVGAYGQEVAQTITSVEALDLASFRDFTSEPVSLHVQQLTNEECGFRYRASRFNTDERGRWLILRVVFELRRRGAPALRYPDLQKYFAGHSSNPSLVEVREGVCEIRGRKGMLIRKGEQDAPSAGSFFRNPLVSQREFEGLSSRLALEGLQLPSYPAGGDLRKLPAAWLVEHAGFGRGYEMGRVGISRKHSLAIVNRGGAAAAEIVALKNSIQSAVYAQFGIELETEPVLLGF